MDASSYGRNRAREIPNGGLWPWRFRLDWRKQSAFVPPAVSRRWLAGGGIGSGRQRQRPPRSPYQLIPQTYLLSPPASLPLALCLRRSSSRMAERLGLSNSEYKRFIYTADFDTMRGRGRARPSTLPRRRSWRRRRWTCSGPRRRRVRCRRCTP